MGSPLAYAFRTPHPPQHPIQKPERSGTPYASSLRPGRRRPRAQAYSDYRLGMVREALQSNLDAIAADEQYFGRYARAVGYARKGMRAEGAHEVAALERLERTADCKPIAQWNIPAREIVQTARAVARRRLADARGHAPAAIGAYHVAIAVQDGLPYMASWMQPNGCSAIRARARQ